MSESGRTMTTPSEQTKSGRVTRLVVRWLTRTVLFVVLAAILGAITVVMIIPRATHGSAMTVLTGSMTPEIPVGSVVLVRPVDTGTLRVGDIATYQKKEGLDEFVTHRIAKINSATTPTRFVFKGDANRGPDLKPVPATAIRGEVWFHVPYLGAVRDSLHGQAGLSLLAMLVLGGYAMSQFAEAIKDRRAARRAVPGTASAEHPPAGEERFEFDRTLIVVTLPTAEMYGTTPYEASRQWGAVLLAQQDEQFTVLLAEPRESAVGAIELLVHFNPISIRVLESPNVIVGQPAGPDIRNIIDREPTAEETASHAKVEQDETA